MKSIVDTQKDKIVYSHSVEVFSDGRMRKTIACVHTDRPL